MSEPIPTAWRALALELADRARGVTLPRFREALTVDDKAEQGFDPVTAADRDAEATIRAHLRAVVPEHGILGEEHGRRAGAGRFRWILDPIDGTRAYIAGLPTWTTLIALLDEGVPVLSVIDAPAARRRWLAHTRPLADGTAPGCTTWHGDDAFTARVRPCPDLSRATLSTTDPELFHTPATRAAWEALRDATLTRRYGADALAYAVLASGRVDLVAECRLQPYDIAALVPVVQAAGGTITTWSGAPPLSDDTLLAAGDPAVHAQALARLAEVRGPA